MITLLGTIIKTIKLNIMQEIYTIGQLRQAIKDLNDNDELVIEIHEGTRNEDLYTPYSDIIHGIVSADGTFISEFRLCI